MSGLLIACEIDRGDLFKKVSSIDLFLSEEVKWLMD
jgi:hypothetical protein